MDRNEFIKLYSKKLAGEISAAEQVLLDLEILKNEEFKLLGAELDRYFSNQRTKEPLTNHLAQVWEKIDVAESNGFVQKFDYQSSKQNIILNSKWLKIASVFVLFTGLSLLVHRLLKTDFNQDLQVAVATDHKTFKMLDDGTKVWLNKKSTISYNAEFGTSKREIFLKGEAFFDVVKNKAVPLIIHVGNVNVEVKGTAFNINAYKENAEIQVALLRGSIQVTDLLDTNYKILLKPNEKLIYNPQLKDLTSKFSVLTVASNVLLSDTKWTADTLTFRKEKLKDLVVKMEKKYDVKIEIQSEQLKEKRFSGTLINETIQQALEALKLSYPLTYTVNNRLVTIKN